MGTGHHNYLDSGLVHDLTRGFLRKNFWVMETQPGCVNWAENNNMLNRGEARTMAWHAVAHGADALLYWQWRSAPGGQEQLHGSLVGADGNPRPFYSEAAVIGKEFAAAAEALANTTPVNNAAILHSYDSRWSINAQRHNKALDPLDILRRFARPLAASNIGLDVVAPGTDLTQYKLVIAPAIAVLNEAEAASLQQYVDAGGLLVLTVRCAQKDSANALFDTLQPGPLRETAGTEVEEFFALESEVPVNLALPGQFPRQATASLWAELLRPLKASTQTVAQFGPCNGWLDDGPAITISAKNENGGQVVYVGALLDVEGQHALTSWLLTLADVPAAWPEPTEGVEFAARKGENGSTILFVINHTRSIKEIPLPQGEPFTDLLNANVYEDVLPLEAYGVRIFAR